MVATFLSTPVGVTRAQEATPASTKAAGARFPLVTDSEAWHAHFEHWVETRLVQPEILAAAAEADAFDPNSLRRTLEEVEVEVIRKLRDRPRLPDQAVPRLLARGLTDRPLEAARLFARGESDAALEILNEPETRDLPAARHLRAQLLDRLTSEADAHPIYRVAVLGLYRTALRADATLLVGDRAKLRIGQIYLELGWLAESRAELRARVGSLGEPYDTQARISLAEACYALRDFACARTTLDSLEPERLARGTLRWVLQRRADTHFGAGENVEALERYTELASDPNATLTPRARLRYGTALVLADRTPEARSVLGGLAGASPDIETAALSGVLMARALRSLNDFGAAEQVALKGSKLGASRDASALGVLEAIESTRPRDRLREAIPAHARDVIGVYPDSAATALLYFRLAASADTDDSLPERARRIGRAVALAPSGPVRSMARRFLASELAGHLAEAVTSEAPVHGEVVELMERYLDPAQLDAGALLLGIDELYRGERYVACRRWARSLVRVEQRPIRHGLASWREIACTRLLASDRNAGNRVLVRADSGNAGPFALALAVRAAEQQLRAGDLNRALRTYSRALAALPEPVLTPPILLRLGELEVEAGRNRSALRSLQRGLSLTEAKELRADPFRKAGVLALGRLAQRGVGQDLLTSTLERERPHVDETWQRIFDYLRARSRAVEGPDVYARARREYQALDDLRRRIESRADRYGDRS